MDLCVMLAAAVSSASRERAKSGSRPGVDISPVLVERFGHIMREKLTTGDVPFRKAYIGSIIDRIELMTARSASSAEKTCWSRQSWRKMVPRRVFAVWRAIQDETANTYVIEISIFEFYLRKLVKHGVSLISITQYVAESDPAPVMMRKVVAQCDEYQSKENAKHVLRAKKENAREGTERRSAALWLCGSSTCARAGTSACKGRSIRMDKLDTLVIGHPG